MIHSGLVSITFRKLSAPEIIALVRRAELEGIEWGGDVHAPHGDLARAREVGRQTRDAGLAVAAYGSYYRIGQSEADGLSFGAVLDTAVALGAPTVRVWAGNRGSADADEGYWSTVIGESRRIADLAQAAGLTISFEYHGRTLTDTNASAARLLGEIDHAQVRSYWQPPVGASSEHCLEGLRGVSAYLSHVHVFHWRATAQGADRRPLAEGAGAWAQYLAAVRAMGRDHYALIEFVRADEPESLLADAGTLRAWLARAEQRR